MIVKVQLPLNSNDETPQAFVYDKTREFEIFLPVTKTLLSYMKGKVKAFFHAHIENDDELVFDDEAEDQDW